MWAVAKVTVAIPIFKKGVVFGQMQWLAAALAHDAFTPGAALDASPARRSMFDVMRRGRFGTYHPYPLDSHGLVAQTG